MKGRLIQTIIGLFTIAFSSYIYYLFGYRNFFLVDMFFAVGILFGWVAFLMGLRQLLKSVKQQPTTDDKPTNVKKRGGCLSFFVFCLLFVGNFIGISILSDQRVATILATRPTKQTIATVVDINVTYGKGGSTTHVIVHYNTDKESLTQELSYKYSSSKIGEQYTIQYSVEYPHMIKVIQ